MNKYTFSTQSGKAYYCNSIPGFIKDKSTSIIGQLVRHSFEINKEQSDAWENQICELQRRLEECGMEGDIIFEYDIVRLGKRIDIILLIRHMVFSLEFKNGKNAFTAQDAQQAEDYAIDIKNFHKESEDLYVCPILIATDAPKYSKPQVINHYDDKQVFLQRENIDTLIPKIMEIIDVYGSDDEIDFEKWFNSPYYPTPTIISAAIEAYNTHDISQIAQSEAGQDNINECESVIDRIVCYAREKKKKCICFVTGVPGAGKTLVGLDVVAKNLEKGRDSLSVYLSGNGPLVEVLREALKKSVADKNINKRETEAAINALYKEQEEARLLRDLNLRRGKVIGRISLFLESVDFSEDKTIDNQIIAINNEIDSLSQHIDKESKEDKLQSIINKINLLMSNWVKDLDVEYENALIRFDLSKLTLIADLDNKSIPLSQMGSGANWVSYHLLIHFALHQHFIQTNRPVPRFLIIDQPTQEYFPPEKDINNDGVIQESSDEIAVKKMFDFIINRTDKLQSNFQVIITDHAYLNEDNFKSCVREVWRNGEKLIPEKWYNTNVENLK